MNTHSGGFEKKFLKLASLIKKIGLSHSEMKDVLAWGELYGRLLSQNFSCLYQDGDFENALINRYLPKSETVPIAFRSRELHVISEAYRSGGHTRLMERLVSFRDNLSDVLVVRPTNDLSQLKLPSKVTLFSSEQGFSLDEIVGIIGSYRVVFMHIHPEDLFSAVAVGIAKKLYSNYVIFVNHADHVFSFGFEHADVVAEISHYGYKINKSFREVRSAYIGIPLNVDNTLSVPGLIKCKKLKLFSAGSRIKYKPPRSGRSFQQLVCGVLSSIKSAEVTVIGPSLRHDWWWWYPKLRYPNRIKIVKSLPYEEYIRELNEADFYLDSFPMTGGTALPEARSMNVFVGGIATGSSGYTPLDILKHRTIDDLVLDLKGLVSGTSTTILDNNNDPEIIREIFYCHAYESVATRVKLLIEGELTPLPAKGGADVDLGFYRRNWSANGVVSFGLSDIKMMLTYKAQGLKVLIYLLFGFGFKNFLSIFVRFIMKSIIRLCLLVSK